MIDSRFHRVFVPLILTVFVAGGSLLLAAAPHLSGTFTVADTRISGDAVHLSFAFSLRSAQPRDVTVEEVRLGNPSNSDRPYATFPGGTIPARGEMKGSGDVTVPKSAFEKWQAGEPAALFVKTPGDSGSTVWTRVDATATSPVR